MLLLLRRVRWRRVVVLLALVMWACYSRPTYQAPKSTNVRLRLNYLERIIGEGIKPATALGRLTKMNLEWGLFTLSFSSYALANLAGQQPALRQEAAETIGRAIALVLLDPIRRPFEFSGPADYADHSLPASVLYLGHLNLMLGCHRQLVPNSPYCHLHDSLSAALYARYQQEPGGNLMSYPNLRWVPDNTVALASLTLHSQLTGSSYAEAGRHWISAANKRLLNPTTGLLASRVDEQGRAREGPRGSMLGWSIWFIARFDSAFARQQYQRYQAANSTNLGVLRFYKERPGSFDTGVGDVDSGPLILGYGIPATAFAFADAVALGDWRNAQRLRRVINLGSREVEENSELRYNVRLVDLDVNPLSEALLLWADVPTCYGLRY
jgi:hypothetical protein